MCDEKQWKKNFSAMQSTILSVCWWLAGRSYCINWIGGVNDCQVSSRISTSSSCPLTILSWNQHSDYMADLLYAATIVLWFWITRKRLMLDRKWHQLAVQCLASTTMVWTVARYSVHYNCRKSMFIGISWFVQYVLEIMICANRAHILN